MKKTFSILLVPTEDKSRLYLLHGKLERSLHGDKEMQHLIVVSDDEIKEGDSFIGLKIKQVSEDNHWVVVTSENKKDYVGSGIFGVIKKIITSSSSLLTPNALLPNSYIDSYVTKYNAGEAPKTIDLEMSEHQIVSDYMRGTKNNISLHPNTTKEGFVIVSEEEIKMYNQDMNIGRPIDFHWRNGTNKMGFDEKQPTYNKFQILKLLCDNGYSDDPIIDLINENL